MSFQRPGGDTPEIRPCQYGASKLLVRGPRRRLDQPFAVFLGGSETFGQFVQSPFAALLERDAGIKTVNLGAVNAGLDAFVLDEDVLGIAARAGLAVIQVLGAQNLSNRFYRVHPRRNDRFLEPLPLLRSMYSEVDFSRFHFNRHLLTALKSVSRHRYGVIEAELKRLWVARMKLLIARMGGHVLVLCLGYSDEAVQGLGREPLLVSGDMLSALRGPGVEVLQVPVVRAGLRGDADQAAIRDMQPPAADHVIGAQTHADIARKLRPFAGHVT